MTEDINQLESEVNRQIELIYLVGGEPYQVQLGRRQFYTIEAAWYRNERQAPQDASALPIIFTDQYDQIKVRGYKKA